MSTIVQVLGLAGACVFAFLLGWAVGGLVTSTALFLIGLAAEREEPMR